MTPTIMRHGGYRFFFFSREETRMHVHVSHTDGEAKYWLQPEVELAGAHGLSASQLAEAGRLVSAHRLEIEHAWRRYFKT